MNPTVQMKKDKGQTNPGKSNPEAGAEQSASAVQLKGKSLNEQQAALAPGSQGFDVQKEALSPVQMKGSNTEDVHAAAVRGTSGSGGALPHLDKIQESFGSHDLSGVQAYSGGAAKEAGAAMGAEAYATGNKVAFASSPSLHTAAHEAAHIVQQRAGVSLTGGVGQAGDRYEQHADQAADAVVSGKSAESVLDKMTGKSAPVQKKEAKPQIQKKQAVQRKPRKASQPPTSGPLNLGGLNVRRMNPNRISAVLGAMQRTAERRRGYGGPSDTQADVGGAGIASEVRRFLSDIRNLRRGSWSSGWRDDNGSKRWVGAWDYDIRVSLNSVGFANPVSTGSEGTHGSSQGGGTGGSDSQGQSTSNTTGVEAGVEAGVGGHQGAPSAGASGSGSLSQTDSENSSSTETTSGSESYNSGQEGFQRYDASLYCEFNVAFKPGTTLGMENVHTKAQNFDGKASFGSVTFDYTSL